MRRSQWEWEGLGYQGGDEGLVMGEGNNTWKDQELERKIGHSNN